MFRWGYVGCVCWQNCTYKGVNMSNKIELYQLYEANNNLVVATLEDKHKAYEESRLLSVKVGFVRVEHKGEILFYFFRGVELTEHPTPGNALFTDVVKMWLERLQVYEFAMGLNGIWQDVTKDISRLVSMVGRLSGDYARLLEHVENLKNTPAPAVKKFRILVWRQGETTKYWAVAQYPDGSPMEFEEFENALSFARSISKGSRSFYTIQNTEQPETGIGAISNGVYDDSENPSIKILREIGG